MIKRYAFLFFLTLLMVVACLPLQANAGQLILNDKFQDTSNVDMNKTTAYVDTSGGDVCLPQQPMPNAMAMKQFGYEYAVATTSGIDVYDYNDTTGKMALNAALSIPSVTNATGIAVRQDSPEIWSLTGNDLTLYSFNGSSMSASATVTGLNNIVSVSTWSNADKAALLSKTGVVTIYNASGGNLTPALTVNTGLNSPVAVSVVPDTPNFVVSTGNAFYFYVYDDATGNYAQDTSKTVTGLSNVLSMSSQQGGVGVLNSSGTSYYSQDDTGGFKRSDVFSVSPISSPVALSIKPDSYDYAVLTNSGAVKYFSYDDGTGTEKELTSMEVTGLTLLSSGYLHPKDYYSKVISTADFYYDVLLTVNENLPAGTSVTWYVSSDGGSTWVQVTPGTWATVNLGNQFAVHAVLDTTDPTATPKIFEVSLEVSKLSISNLEVTGITYPQGAPTQPVVNPPITTFPVTVYAGSQVQFQVTTTGNASQVVAQFSDGQLIILTPQDLTLPETNTWVGVVQVSPQATDGTLISVTFTASDSQNRKAYLVQNPFLKVQGNVSQFSKVILTQ